MCNIRQRQSSNQKVLTLSRIAMSRQGARDLDPASVVLSPNAITLTSLRLVTQYRMPEPKVASEHSFGNRQRYFGVY